MRADQPGASRLQRGFRRARGPEAESPASICGQLTFATNSVLSRAGARGFYALRDAAIGAQLTTQLRDDGCEGSDDAAPCNEP